MAVMPRLLGISPGDHGCGRTLSWIIQGAVDGGLRGLVLRDPHLSTVAYVELARRLSPLLGPGLILHGSHPEAVHIANRAGWGLHMPASMEWAGVRAQVKGWLGASCHNADELARAVEAGVDYAMVSPIFPPISKPGETRQTLGIKGLEELMGGVEIPIFALGGVDASNVRSLIEVGVHGVGSMGFLFPGDADADVAADSAAHLTALLG